MAKLYLLAALLTGCTAQHAVRHPYTRTPLAAILADAAVFSAGSCIGMDAQFGSQPHDTRNLRMAIGYGAALAVWLPLWFVETR